MVVLAPRYPARLTPSTVRVHSLMDPGKLPPHGRLADACNKQAGMRRSGPPPPQGAEGRTDARAGGKAPSLQVND